jgi:hypothetical protein
MTAAEITEKVFALNGEIRHKGRFIKVSTADWVVFAGTATDRVFGVMNLLARLYTGAMEDTLTFGTATINNGGTAYSATDTSIVIASGAITRVPPYYIQTTSGEILFVTSETAANNAASTLTVKRGCLGTTASATGLTNSSTIYIRQIVYFGAATSGVVEFEYTPMPTDPGTKLFYTDGA